MPLIVSERYEIDPQPIGRGGFGEVYKAIDHLFDRPVVIKTIVASQLYGIDDARIRRQFFKESAVSAKLGQKSEYIVKVLDFGYDKDSSQPFFVMEYVDGHDLSRAIGSLDWDRIIVLLDQMLCALKIAHENGVIHSDISPDNIMTDNAGGMFKLNDFGLARLLNSNLLSRGSIKSLVGGKPAFLPPGHFSTGERTPFSDLYSLAATLMQLRTGMLPKWTYRDGGYSLEDPRGLLLDRRREPRSLIEVNTRMYSIHGSIFNDEESRSIYVAIHTEAVVELIHRVLHHQIDSIDQAIDVLRKGAMHIEKLPIEEGSVFGPIPATEVESAPHRKRQRTKESQ